MKNSYLLIGLGIIVIGGVALWATSDKDENAPSKPIAATEMAKKDPAPKVPAPEMNKEAETPASESEMGKETIVDIAVGNGNFKTLVTALQTAGLVETLSGPGPFTVFAPTDAAFAKLPAGTVETLLQDKEKLTSILTYHVVSGTVMAKDVVKLTSAPTLNGQSVKIDATNGVKINTATVVTPDIVASNGVIHVIDTVLLPQE